MDHVRPQQQITGRRSDLQRLLRAIGPGDDGLRLVHVHGPSGIGKTTLLQAACDAAARDDAPIRFRAAMGRARSEAVTVPYAPWIEAAGELSDLLAPPANVLVPDIDELAPRVAGLLHASCLQQPMVLAFDDAQSLDESSLALLLAVVGELDPSTCLSVVVVEQSDALEPAPGYSRCIEALNGQHVVQRIELGPMDDAEVRELAAAVLREAGGEHDHGLVADIATRSCGNPWFARALADSHLRGERELPGSIAAAARSRMARLDDHGRDLVIAVALCADGAHADWLHALAEDLGLAHGEVLAALQRSRLVCQEGDVVAVAHPMMRQVVLDSASSATRRALHQLLAEAIDAAHGGGEAQRDRLVARHLAGAGRIDDAVQRYLRAGEYHEAERQPYEAAADYVRALAVEPRIDRRQELVRRCAIATTHISDPRAAGFWNELCRIAAVRNDDETYAFALFQQYWTSYDGANLERLRRAARLGANRYGWAARAAACLAVQDGDFAAAVAHDEVALAIAQRNGDQMLEVLALETLGASYVCLERLEDSARCLGKAAQLAEELGQHDTVMHARTTLAEVLAQDLRTDAGLQQCELALAWAEDHGLRRYQPFARAFLALSLSRHGRLTEAREQIEQAAADDATGPRTPFSALVAGIRAQVAIDVGDPLAGQLLDQALELVEYDGMASFRFEVQLDQARWAALSGDVRRALAVAAQLEGESPEPTARLAAWLARAALRSGSADAIALAESQLRGGTGPLVRLLERETHATIAAMRNDDPEPLAAVVEEWQRAGRTLDALRAQVSHALALSRAGEGEQAIGLLRELQLAFAVAGALPDVDFVAAHLRTAGRGGRARTRLSGVGNLTERELQVAHLVAEGLRNGEIAERLLVADRTIAAHLSRIYGKVGVRSRSHLAAWLKEQLDAAPAHVA